MKKMIHVSVMYQPMDANGMMRRSRGVTFRNYEPCRRHMRKAMGISNRSFRKMGLNRNFRTQ